MNSFTNAGTSQDDIVIYPRETQVLEIGESVDLNCSVQSGVSYTWSLTDGEGITENVSNSSNHTVFYDDPEDTMYGGTYTCEAIDNETDTFTASVFIAFAPVFTTSPVSFQVQPGDYVVLTCNATGFPAPNITWVLLPTNNGSDVSTADIEMVDETMAEFFTDNSTDSSSVLTFDSIESDEFGFYACIAMQSSDSLKGVMETSVPSEIATVTGKCSMLTSDCSYTI